MADNTPSPPYSPPYPFSDFSDSETKTIHEKKKGFQEETTTPNYMEKYQDLATENQESSSNKKSNWEANENLRQCEMKKGGLASILVQQKQKAQSCVEKASGSRNNN